MDSIVQDTPNLKPEVVPVQEVSTGLEAIAAKMAAMRNQIPATEPTETGRSKAAAKESPVAPEGVEVDNNVDDNNIDLVEPEVVAPEAEDSEAASETEEAPEEVSQSESSDAEVIDFLEFAETNPTAKFKFKRNGKEIEIDAKKAAAILGQGAAISEDARQLKIEKSEFDEYLQTKRAETEGLLLAMEFTVRPQLQKAYDEIVKTQNYQTTFQQQLAQTSDPAQRARIEASIAQNERYIQQQAGTINQLKPNVDQFYQIRQQQVSEVLENSRKNFKDKELRNQYVYNEIRTKVSEGWAGAEAQLVPGIKNIDLISSDEHLMSLVRDGLKYRDKPKAKSAGSSIAALTTKRSGTPLANSSSGDEIANLRKQARAGDQKAADNLLVAQMKALRAGRK
jgi:ribosomal protein S16